MLSRGFRTSSLQRAVHSDSFVSEHFRVDPAELLAFIARKNFKYVESSDKYTIQRCPFCKNINDKQDNMYKLSIFKGNGGFNCFRCGNKGSWFALQQKLSNFSTLTMSGSSNGSLSSVSSEPESSAPLPQPNQDEVNQYPANLFKNPTALARLTGTGPGCRGLSEATLRKYRVGLSAHKFQTDTGWEEQPCVTFPWLTWNSDHGDFVTERIKLRSLTLKSNQRILPPGGAWGFFGWHIVPASESVIILTEGEYDAMAVYQATGRCALSLPNGARSLPPALLPCLERFEKIILWMDDDPAGHEGAEKFVEKLGVKRCLVVSNSGAKDANDALLQGLDLNTILNSAAPLPHEQIISFKDLRDDVYRQLTGETFLKGAQCTSLPSFNKLLKGHRRGELTILTGSTGIGKTTILSQLSLDYAQQGPPTNCIHVYNHTY
jgi:twinkle protein